MSSRVSRLATGYLGDLAVGDRMLEVPARTAGLSAAWTASRWSAVGSLARAFDWVNYDKVALATTIAADATGERIPVGTALRAYWRSYEGNAHASLRLSYAMLPRSWISVSGDNLLNHQVGEPDDITVVPGRTGPVRSIQARSMDALCTVSSEATSMTSFSIFTGSKSFVIR